MFIKTTEVKNLIVYTKSFTEEEIKTIKEELSHFEIYFLIPIGESIPFFLSDNKVLTEEQNHRYFDYQNLIQNLVNESNVKSCHWVMISKDIEQIKIAIKQPIGTLLVSNTELQYEDIGFMPDLKVPNVNQIKDFLNTKIGYFAEVCSTIISKDNQSYGDSGVYFDFNVAREGFVFKVIALGRYFKTTHEYFNCHQLSKRITRSKFDFKIEEKLFFVLYNSVISMIKNQKPIDGVTRVPSRPSKEDRFRDLVQMISDSNNINNYSDILLCTTDYSPHKELASNQRFENVRGVFSVNQSIDGEHIVVIDDVIASGATLFEVAKTLYLRGAREVTAVVLGVNQFSNGFTSNDIFCPQCRGKMKLKINSKENTAFYGCENYNEFKCRYSEEFIEGWHNILEQNCINVNLEGNDDSLFF
ncbi:phosphoribosyltransferase family protein [Bacillus sp. FSL W8-0445]|uniref:Phosphoribosyltransferase domain-containing protein n=1 Tax=Bacillus licheniformis TaxID=1402 RepID=A0A8B5YHS2_BACLI|nr:MULTISPECIES: phosphoribosyltransferase family protein [Bacillus]AWV42249.1 competence protein [Bacillus licheniformis]AZN77970.1 competence protein [Bacillus licheniformis]KYC97902.1 hypothetical protein B4164_3689 [Bacillus licheniformis]MCC2132144.1 competence protein [Bacillus licheniformis]MCC2144499.1 competence protein [Bacillus licheniformis]